MGFSLPKQSQKLDPSYQMDLDILGLFWVLEGGGNLLTELVQLFNTSGVTL